MSNYTVVSSQTEFDGLLSASLGTSFDSGRNGDALFATRSTVAVSLTSTKEHKRDVPHGKLGQPPLVSVMEPFGAPGSAEVIENPSDGTREHCVIAPKKRNGEVGGVQ